MISLSLLLQILLRRTPFHHIFILISSFIPIILTSERQLVLCSYTGGRRDATKRVPQTRGRRRSVEDCLSDWRPVGQDPFNRREPPHHSYQTKDISDSRLQYQPVIYLRHDLYHLRREVIRLLELHEV